MVSPDTLHITEGICSVVFAFDVGASIQLEKAEQRITAIKERGRIKRQRPAPQYFDYHPPPLRITHESEPLMIGSHHTHSGIESILYDFGAITVIYRIPIQGSFSSLLSLSQTLYDNAILLETARQHVSGLLLNLEGIVEKANLAPFMEDYNIFHIASTEPSLSPQNFLEQCRESIAQILRCEDEPLSKQEIQEATSQFIAFGQQDMTLIDWNAALMLGEEMDDVREVLEFVNVELVERRFLDDQLDQALDEAYATLTGSTWYKLRWPGTMAANLRRIAGLQVDSAILFERVTNTLKLLGDQYLARVYRMASQRFYLQSWDTSVLRKLDTLDNLYEKMTDHTGNRRMEILEWIIIILIAVSIVLPFIPGFPGY